MADLSKINAYAVEGGADTAESIAKLVAYAVTTSSDTYESLAKMVAYAVVEASTSAARPVVFVCT